MPTIPYKKNETYMMAGDVGGTKTLMGIFRPTKNYPVFDVVQTFSSADYPDLESVVEEYLKTRQVLLAGACFGIAGPVENGQCVATNIPWEVSEKRLLNKFSWPHVRLINDLVALGEATQVLKNEELLVLQEGEPHKDGVRGMVAPGTGLGISLMVKVKDEYVALPSEGGHMDFAPGCEEELELWQYIRKSMGHVSAERIVSGPGLITIYRWLISKNQEQQPPWLVKKMNQEDPAHVISQAALAGDDLLCRKALELFVSVLGAVAGNLALIGLTYGGIYLGGGIVPKILPFLSEENFLRSFSDKGRFRQLLKTIPVYVILNDQASLLGAAVHLCNECGFTEKSSRK
jgi:glucokinase